MTEQAWKLAWARSFSGREALPNDHRLEGLKGELHLAEHPQGVSNKALPIADGCDVHNLFTLHHELLLSYETLLPPGTLTHIKRAPHPSHILTARLLVLPLAMLVKVPLECGLMPLLQLVLVSEGTIHRMLQGNVVVEVNLLGPFQGELRSVQVPQEGV